MIDWQFPYPSQRAPVVARNVVATSQPLAAQAGLDAMRRGGNAVDAALTAAITLTVVEPNNNGVGSDAFAIVGFADGSIHGLNASGRSPAEWTYDRFARGRTGSLAMPMVGWDSVTVPGAVSAWVALSERFGKLPFERLFDTAIRYAEDGFHVGPKTAFYWQLSAPRFREFPDFIAHFLPGGRAPRAGELFRRPDLARTLCAIAETRGEAFYRGDLAQRITDASRRAGGAMTAADLDAHRPLWVTPTRQAYRGIELHEIPPNGQGLAAQLALAILSHFDLAAWPADDVRSVHVQIEAMKIAIRAAFDHFADPDAMLVTPEQLLGAARLKRLADGVGDDASPLPPVALPIGHDTVYLTAADADGTMVSMIQSNYMGFGSGVVVDRTGISLQNRGADFAVTQGHPNRVGPNKRPYHTIIPGFVTKDDAPVMSFGVMGGTMQPQGHVQVLVRIADHGQNPQAACDGPRFRWVHGVAVSCEKGFPDSTLDGLRQRGHDLVAVDDYSQFGSCQAIWRLDGGYLAASDPRRDGQAVGF